VVAAAVVILVTAGFTAYTLLSPALGVVLWAAALMTAVIGIALSVTHRRTRRTRRTGS
jgi:membrane associated rhomboid family serine protease